MISYKGYEIPNIKEEILNISTQVFLSNDCPSIPALNYPVKGTSAFINMPISIEEFYNAEEAELDEYIDKYIQITKKYIDKYVQNAKEYMDEVMLSNV